MDLDNMKEKFQCSDVASRGTKRKQSGDEGRPSFAQRLAASRQAVQRESSSPVGADSGASEASLESKDESSPAERICSLEEAQQEQFFRTLYVNDLDFLALGKEDDGFNAYLSEGGYVNFNDPKAVVSLTKVLLRSHFRLRIKLPDDRLCPPVPNRHNYILWLKELIDSTSSTYSEVYEPNRAVRGLDIGTGASAIYPLIGCAQRPSWSFIGTDIDQKSFEFACDNVKDNNLESRIRILQRTLDDRLIPLDELGLDKLDFVMTNPPFYASESELVDAAKQKSQPPNSVCTGAPNEMVCTGGEVGFFRRILEESLLVKDRVQWYTTMLGKQTSIEVAVKLLREHDIDNYAITQFVQGKKTRRWAVGWSFLNRRPGNEICRGCEPSPGKQILPNPTEYTIAAKSTKQSGIEQTQNIFWTQLEDLTDGLDLVSWKLDEGRLRVVGFADENVWSRAYRRNRAKHLSDETGIARIAMTRDISKCAFGFSISIKKRDDQDNKLATVAIVVRWLQGIDYSLFESFYGMLRNAFLRVV